MTTLRKLKPNMKGLSLSKRKLLAEVANLMIMYQLLKTINEKMCTILAKAGQDIVEIILIDIKIQKTRIVCHKTHNKHNSRTNDIKLLQRKKYATQIDFYLL